MHLIKKKKMFHHHCLMPSSKKIFFALTTFFAILFISRHIMESSKNKVIKESEEFRIEFKDVNISYKYYDFDMKDCDNETNILIATLSQPNTYYLRMGIRNSWKRDIPKTFTHKFFIGLTQNETLQKMNENEAQKYGDIIFTNLIDSYLNLTLKMSSVFQWQQKFCPKINFFLRADEDTVLDVSRFQHYLNIKFNMLKRSYGNTTIFGTLLKNSPVFRDPNGKWYIPYELYNNTHFPPYESGSSYLAAPWAIDLMLKEAKNQNYITVDDAFFTGIIAEKAKIPRISAHRHFAYRNPLATNSWDQQCDDNGIPLLFSIVDENGEIKISPNGHEIALKKLKELKCSLEK